MKNFKRFTAAIAATLMAASLSVPMAMNVSAASITINGFNTDTNNDDGVHTYEAYQIFKGDYSEGVLSNISWGDGIDSEKIEEIYTVLSTKNAKFSKVVNEETVPLTSAAEVAEVLSTEVTKDSDLTKLFADVVSEYLGTAQGTSDDEGKISSLSNGYYLVQDKENPSNSDPKGDNQGAKTRYILEVAGSDVTVQAKSSAPSVIKKVKEDDKGVTSTGQTFAGQENYDVGTGYNDVADYCIGEDIPFRLYGTLPSTLDDYTTYFYQFTDTLAPSLTLKESSVNVFVDGQMITSENYTFEKANEGNSFTVTFNDIKGVTGVTAGSIITVDYKATLNENAVIGLDGQENKVKLTYSTNPNYKGVGDTDNEDEHGETPEDKVIVFTYEIDTIKVDGKTTSKTLKGAEFILGNEEGTAWATVTNGKFAGWTQNEANATTLTTDDDGKIQIQGLDSGKYMLKETKAPDGYNTPSDAFTVELSANTYNNQVWDGDAANALVSISGTVDGKAAKTINNGDNKIAGIEGMIANNAGSTLPSTGGMGTKLFFLGGGSMAAVAGIFLITKKRMGKSAE